MVGYTNVFLFSQVGEEENEIFLKDSFQKALKKISSANTVINYCYLPNTKQQRFWLDFPISLESTKKIICRIEKDTSLECISFQWQRIQSTCCTITFQLKK